MVDVLYIEEEVAGHPRVAAICDRFPRAVRIPCDHYGEVFNRRAQNFRLQKRRPALILARKHSRFLHETPAGYGVGGQRNYYFSHMLNCVYDCRYCFLQGMHRSGHYVLFVNYEDYQHAIEAEISAQAQNGTWFFSGYDCDSLAFEPVSGFADSFLPLFRRYPRAMLELRTKSTQIRSLLNREVLPNVVVAYSFTPGAVSRAMEHKVPGLDQRIEAMARLQARGWRLGLRFDPLIYYDGYMKGYGALFEAIFARLAVESLHSVSLGPFRLPRQYFDTMARLYPDERLFAGPLRQDPAMVGYDHEIEEEMIDGCTRLLKKYVPDTIMYPCSYT